MGRQLKILGFLVHVLAVGCDGATSEGADEAPDPSTETDSRTEPVPGTEPGSDGGSSDAMTMPHPIQDASLDASDAAADPPVLLTPAQALLITRRPYSAHVPASYSAAKPAVPLVIGLHGAGSVGSQIASYFSLTAASDAKGFILATPNGASNVWNATDGCCAGASGVDDVAYLTAVIDHARTKYKIDRKRIFVVGHSNGGFMSHRMACDRADRVAAIVSVSGATWLNAAKCNPSERVAILQVHGDMDTVIPYGGGSLGGRPMFPSALGTVQRWATENGCASTRRALSRLDIDTMIAGQEARREAFDGCPSDRGVELWTIEGATHSPRLGRVFRDSMIDFLYAHPKP